MSRITSVFRHQPKYALSFVGSLTSYVDCGNNASLNISPPLTYEAWINPHDRGGDSLYYIITKSSGTSGIGLGVVRVGGALPVHSLFLFDGTASISTSANQIKFDTCQHVACTNDGTTSKLYINAILVATAAQTLNNAPTINQMIGKRSDYGGYAGLIDEVRIWNVVRSNAEIRANMNARMTGQEAGLKGYWRCTEGVGTTVLDSVLDRYTNILGTDGSCESLAPFTTNSGATLSSTQVKQGTSSIKLTGAASAAYFQKDYNTLLSQTKYYILGGWVFIESWTSGFISLVLDDIGVVTVRYRADANNTTLGVWQFLYVKVPTLNTLVGTGFRLLVGNSGNQTFVAYCDAIRIYEISASDYAAIGTTYTTATSPSIDDFIPYAPRAANNGTINGGATWVDGGVFI